MVNLGIVAAEFNAEITDTMLEQAKAHAVKLGAPVKCVLRVPGAFDAPLAIKKLLEREDVDAVVVLGAIVTGGTKHDEVIANVLASKIADLSLSYGKPVALGVSGPGMTYEQARERAADYAERSVSAAVRMITALKELK